MMNFGQSDALGGFMEGEKFRQQYRTNDLAQQNTLEQIANSQQTREFNAAAEPGKRAQESRLNDLHPGAMQRQEDQLDDAKRKKANDLVNDWMTMPDGPGTEQFLIDKYKIPANHPIIAASRDAKQQGPEAVEALKAKFAISDQKSRDAAVSAKNLADREDKRWEAAAAKARETKATEQETAFGVADRNAASRVDAAIERAKTSGAAKDPNMEKQLVRLANEARQVNQDPNIPPGEKGERLKEIASQVDYINTLWNNNAINRRQAGEVDINAATKGKVTTNPALPAPTLPGANPQAAPAATATSNDPRAAAMAAIAKGAPRAAVAQRYKEATGQDL